MMWLTVVLRFGALMLSVVGYTAFARAFLAIPRYFSYLFSLSAIGCAVFVAGLLGWLAAAVYPIFGLGILLLLVVLLSGKFRAAFRRPTLTLANMLFLIWFAVTFTSLINYRLIHYDNFSHWALVVKQMLITGRFPDAGSALIDFQNYPLGTSAFLYYVGKVVGHSDGVMLVGQSLLIFACFYALFGAIRDTKRFLLIALTGLFGAVMSHFNISIRINNLLVDYLLPLYALAVIAGLLECGKRYAVGCLAAIPVLGMLLVIKSTGMFFAIPAFLFLLYQGCVTSRGKPFWQRALTALGGLLTIAASTAFLWLWNAHEASTFAGEASKFSIDWQALLRMNWRNLAAMVPDKTPEQMAAIAALFVQTVFSPGQLATQGWLLVNALALVAWLNARFGFGLRWKLLRVLVLADLLMVVYDAGILVFYIVSMPLNEALRLAGFERYAASMLLFVIGVLGLCTVRDVERSLYVQQGEERDYRAFKTLQSKRVYMGSTLLAFTLAMLLLVTDLAGMNALQENYANTLPAHAETVLGNRWEPGDTRRYLLYAPDTDRQVSDDYLLYVGRYLLFDPEVATTAVADETLFTTAQGYDYFAIVESDPAIRSLMLANTGLDGAPGVYSVQDAFAQWAVNEGAP